jgi:hypothetical protein
MAVVKSIENPIKTGLSVYKAVEYITNPQKTSLVSYENCCEGKLSEIAQEFRGMRIAYDQNKGILAHHYIQSFAVNDNITPEQAHEIALEWIRKNAPDFQVVVATHVDTEKIHNHFIINSCNIETGKKWHGNLTTLKAMRNESDLLCVANGLSVINNESGRKAIDQATYQLAKQGKSWKFGLVSDLDSAVTTCRGKSEFIAFMNKRGYAVRYKDRHITFTKYGEEKGIRADTLARQFGEKYTKANLEKAMGYEAEQTYYMHYDRELGILSLRKKDNSFRKEDMPLATKSAKPETDLQKNYRINNELKAQSEESGDKLRYKVVTADELERVKLTDVKFAEFVSKGDSEKFNLVYLDSDSARVDFAVYAKTLGR